MNKRSKIWAMLGAGVLTLGIAGVALAIDLNPNQVGNTLGSFTNDCSDFPLEVGAGQIGVHFIQNQTGDASGLLDAEFSNPATIVNDLADTPHPSTTLHWYVVITGDADTVIESASSTAGGDGLLNVSHVCAGAEESQTIESQPVSAPPSFSSSEQAETDTPTECPCDTIGEAGTSGPSDGAWLLVVALGVLLASVVVLTPARVKNRR